MIYRLHQKGHHEVTFLGDWLDKGVIAILQ